ncbi:MAG: phospho-sugar mutase [Acidobacteriota bacterium]|nr:phospho-sugar mutase [Acidobacteriota bacterium]
MNPELAARAAAWAAADPDEDDRAAVVDLLEAGEESALEQLFAAPLRFGTAGLRGPVRPGPAGMNRATVRRATQGVAAWLGESGADLAAGVVVGRDARRGSESFNDEVVGALLGAGVAVHEMPGPLPTPLVPFAVTALGAAAGVMVTASHNPPEDNGYKLYAGDGAQIVPPTDEIVERYMGEAGPTELASRDSPLHRVVTAALLARYRDHLVGRFASATSGLRIAYTPLHGVGGATALDLLSRAGHRRVAVVERQFAPDGAFPTVTFPNPEEPGALDLAFATAAETDADLILANDPDADRLGVAVREGSGYRVLRGDEVGWLLGADLLEDSAAPGDAVAASLVSSTMLAKMAAAAGVRHVTTLTGFKWIARAARPGVLRFGYEEALGYAVDPFVADKDGISAALALAGLAERLRARGSTLATRLDELEQRFGVHAGAQLSIRLSGPDAAVRIAERVSALRAEPPSKLGGVTVSAVDDLARGWRGLPPTDGLYLHLGDLGRVVVRPSGTEPKLKCYLEVTPGPGDLVTQRARAAEVLDALRVDLEARLA